MRFILFPAAVVTHFAFLASCAWLNVVAFDVWRYLIVSTSAG